MTSGCLDRKEIRGAIWGVHSTGTGQPVETQDVFFWHLAGRSAPTGLAIVHWIGCINAIKYIFVTFFWSYQKVLKIITLNLAKISTLSTTRQSHKNCSFIALIYS